MIIRKTVSKKSIDWRTAAKEAFGDMPRTALNLRGLRYREDLTQGQHNIYSIECIIKTLTKTLRTLDLGIEN